VLFFGLFLLFFGIFSVVLPPGKFSADALVEGIKCRERVDKFTVVFLNKALKGTLPLVDRQLAAWFEDC